MIKIVLSILLSTLIYDAYSQSNSKFEANCDSVILLDGSLRLLNIQETKKNKILYFLCCDDCAVPRELRLSSIDTVIYRKVKSNEERSTKNMKNRGYEPQLEFKSLKNKKKLKKMNNGSKTIIWTSDSTRYKGRFYISGEDSLRINSTTVAMDSIISISKPNLAAKITGDLFGIFFTTVGIGLIGSFGLNDEGLVYGGAAFGVATPFFMMNLIRKKFNIREKWKVHVIYHPI